MHGGFFGVEVFFVISGFLITSLLVDERVTTGRNDLGALLDAAGEEAAAGARRGPARGERVDADRRHGGAVVAAASRHAMGRVLRRQLGPDRRRGAVLRPRRPTATAAPLESRGRGAVVSALAIRVRRAQLARLAGAAHCLPARRGGIGDLRAGLVRCSRTTRTGSTCCTSRLRHDLSGLLLGAAFAFAWRRWRHRPDRLSPALLDAAAATALAVLGVCFVVGRVTAAVTYPWTMALVSITSAIAVVLTVHPGAVRTRRLLGSGGMAAIGRRSYGIYLWHWPVFVVVGATAGSWPRFVVGLAVALLLSETCYRCVEMPIRRGALERTLGTAPAARRCSPEVWRRRWSPCWASP